MKILLVHGVGHSDASPDYYAPWKAAIAEHLRAAGAPTAPTFVELHYDDLFDAHYNSPVLYPIAIAEMLGSAAYHTFADPISGLFHRSRDLSDDIRWKAGMVAQLTVEAGLRNDLRDRLADLLDTEAPDVIAAHSLGTLITYDFFRNDPRGATAAPNATYITFGSQINNTCARSKLFPGPIKVPNVKFWFHLFNPHDPVLTADIKLSAANFQRVVTDSRAGHDPLGTAQDPGYLNHANTAVVYRALATRSGAREFTRATALLKRLHAKPRRRALLVGIDSYSDPAARLDGCVNDTFTMSAVLQERGFAAEDIRVVLNDRATADGIRERLDWLFDEADDGMERVLFYSGHGAQMPGYNMAERVDHVDECLVPYDFAWTRESAITDDDLFTRYSNLPFAARVFMVLDCCHAGGMHRDGGPRVRGIVPPDDIRHRMLEWDRREHMWRERAMHAINDQFGGDAANRAAYMGRNGCTFRLGRGMRGRSLKHAVYRTLPADERGPFLPVIVESCSEGGKAYEYREGTASYGAFTFALARTLRAQPNSTFERAVSRVAETLKRLGFDQQPQILGPSAIVKKRVPGVVRRGSLS